MLFSVMHVLCPDFQLNDEQNEGRAHLVHFVADMTLVTAEGAH